MTHHSLFGTSERMDVFHRRGAYRYHWDMRFFVDRANRAARH
jgi:hypothetical protein